MLPWATSKRRSRYEAKPAAIDREVYHGIPALSCVVPSGLENVRWVGRSTTLLPGFHTPPARSRPTTVTTITTYRTVRNDTSRVIPSSTPPHPSTQGPPLNIAIITTTTTTAARENTQASSCSPLLSCPSLSPRRAKLESAREPSRISSPVVPNGHIGPLL